jgi:predicted kinase
MTETRTLAIPALSLVVLVGASGSGKSTFARRHFLPTEVISSDFCRGLVSDDENDQAATKDAFELLHFIAAKRLAAGRLTVVDATSVRREDRKPLVELARRYHVLPVVIVLDLPEKVAHARNRDRPDRQFGPHVVRNQTRELRRARRGSSARAFGTSTSSPARKRSRRRPSSARSSGTTAATRSAPSTSSVTSTAAATSSSGCSPSSATSWSRSAKASSRTAGPSTRTPRAGGRSSSAISSTAGHGSSTRSGSRATWSRPATRSACPATTT